MDEQLRENLIGIQFGASGYCPACAGWNANPADPTRGCTPGWHTRTCWLRKTIDGQQSPSQDSR